MKQLNPDAQKELTVLAVTLSGADRFKAIGPSIVYLPTEAIISLKGGVEPLVFHVCRAAKLLTALKARVYGGREYELLNIWKQHCGIIFPVSSKVLFCSKCFYEFDGKLYTMLTVFTAAGKLTL